MPKKSTLKSTFSSSDPICLFKGKDDCCDGILCGMNEGDCDSHENCVGHCVTTLATLTGAPYAMVNQDIAEPNCEIFALSNQNKTKIQSLLSKIQ